MTSETPSTEQAHAAQRPSLVFGLFALLALQLFVSIRYPWEDATYLETVLRPNTDLFVLLALGLAAGLLLRLRFLPALFITAALGLIPVYRAGATLVPALYGKPLVVYNDAMMLPGLLHIVLLNRTPLEQVLWSAAVVIAVALIAVVLYRVVRLLLEFAPSEGPRRLDPTLATLFVLAGLFSAVPLVATPGSVTQASTLVELADEVDETLLEWGLHREYERSLSALHREREAAPSDLARLQGADVYVLYVESYGRALYRKPEHKAELVELTERLQLQLDHEGFYTCSAFATSAVFGGSSSLAHAQLLSGTTVRSKHYYASLLASELEPLPHQFNRAGYRTLNVQPATTAEWPEGKFFGFTEDHFNDRFSYSGHTYHWGFMPDQFALAHLLAEEIRPSRKPVFLQYVSVTSHAPFSMVPPYYEDWTEALEPRAFDGAPVKTYPIDVLNYTGHPDVEAGYVDTIHYSLETMIGFACQLERPSLVLVLGDHQPPGIGDFAHYDKSFEIPIHVLSNRPELLLPFVNQGFQAGFVPTDEYEAFDLSLLAPSLVSAFSTASSEPVRDH